MTTSALSSEFRAKLERRMVPAFGYLRVSGKSQLDGDGFPRQREAIEQYARDNDYRVVQWFEERGIPGKTEWEARPAWVEMVTALNGSSVIIVERLDRLARELFIQEYILRDLKKRGVELLSTAEPDLDSDPTRVLFRQIMGALAQYDRCMIVMKLAAARKRMKERTGRCEGRKPYGMKRGELPVIRRMRELRAGGATYDQIAEKLNSNGISTRNPEGQWFGSTVSKILARQATTEGR